MKAKEYMNSFIGIKKLQYKNEQDAVDDLIESHKRQRELVSDGMEDYALKLFIRRNKILSTLCKLFGYKGYI